MKQSYWIIICIISTGLILVLADNLSSTTQPSASIVSTTLSSIESKTITTTDISLNGENEEDDTDYENKTDDLANKNEESDNENDGEIEKSDAAEEDYFTDSDEEEEEYEEERCTLKTFLAGINITEFYPADRNILMQQYDSVEDKLDRLRISPSVNFTFTRMNRLLNLTRDIASQQEIRSGVTNFIHQNFDLFLELELGSECINAIISMMVAIRRSESWAFEFLDAGPKLLPGIMSGIGSYLGNFDQCISIQNPASSSENYKGQYCLVKPILPLPEKIIVDEQSEHLLANQTERIFRLASRYNAEKYFKLNPITKFIEIIKSNRGRMTNFAICLPDACQSAKLEIALNKFLYPITGMPIEIEESSCWTKNKINDYSLYMDVYAQFALLIIGIILLLVIFATIYEIYPWLYSIASQEEEKLGQKSNFKFIHSFVDVFSAIGNTGKLISYDPNEPEILFDTIRLWAVVLIGLFNAFYIRPLSQTLQNISLSVPNELFTSRKYFFLRTPSIYMDNLIIITGALFIRELFCHFIHYQSANRSFGFLFYLIKRWFILTVPIIGSILFLYLLPSTGYGPLWYRINEVLMPPCKKTGSIISSLFHFSNWNFILTNYTNDDAYVVCNPETWITSIIFQLNIIFYLIVFLIYKSPKKGLRFLILLIIFGQLLNISPRLFLKNIRTYYEMEKQPSFWHFRQSYFYFHQNIIQYIGSFSVGLLLGYAIIVYQNMNKNGENGGSSTFNAYSRKERTHNGKNFIYNTLAIIGIGSSFIWADQLVRSRETDTAASNELSVLLYFSIGRFIYSLSFSWIIYACISNKSIFLRQCLNPVWIQPIVRLSFSLLLVQPMVQYHRLYSIKETYTMTFRNTIENYICDLIISIILAYVLYLLFLAPANRLSVLLFNNQSINPNNQLDMNRHTIEPQNVQQQFRPPANNEPQNYNLTENTKNYNWLKNNDKYLPQKKSKSSSKKTNNDTVCYETNDNVISIRF